MFACEKRIGVCVEKSLIRRFYPKNFHLQALDIPDHLRAPMKQLRKACMAQSGVEEKYIDASKNGNLPDVPELKCYILCLLEHAGMIEENGEIHWTDVYHLLTPSTRETVDSVVKECATKRKYSLKKNNSLSTLFLSNILHFRWINEM